MSACVSYSDLQSQFRIMDGRKRKPESHEFSFSIADLYNLAETQQKRAKGHFRRYTAEPVSSSNRVKSPDERYSSLPDIFSRTSTAISEPLPIKKDSVVDKNLPLTPMTCLRSESTLNEEYYNMVSSLCRQCCDVLGPKACNQCVKVFDRKELLRKSENIYPNLEMSEENVATTNTLHKYLPQLSFSEIQDTIATGKVARTSLKSEVKHRRELSKIINECVPYPDSYQPRKNTRVVLQHEGSTQAFFVNIKALNAKIVSGEVPKDLKSFSKMKMQSKGKPTPSETVSDNVSFSELICPTFVSPRKQPKEKQMYSAYYTPPLLSVARQNVEPMFFAGSDKPYQLPERLPDKVVPGQDDPEVHPRYGEQTSSPEVD